ncbi:chaperone modulator CbpM [Tropicimonas sp. IMCC34043]|uniref:chaperone modulator CbpM n=1 Tax=Tropicimonas sp. IMCC34043 TaxID=2248760 RepID=UPI000E22B6AE|nr:chaperone modulator CbpM [Tropicimonas sp. IMCC34043]
MMTESDILDRVGRLSVERLQVCVTRAWVRPRQSERGRVFDETDLARLRLIVELTEDMDVNDEAVPMILTLIDEVSTLRRRMRAVDAAMSQQGAEACEALIARLRQMQQTPQG